MRRKVQSIPQIGSMDQLKAPPKHLGKCFSGCTVQGRGSATLWSLNPGRVFLACFLGPFQ